MLIKYFCIEIYSINSETQPTYLKLRQINGIRKKWKTCNGIIKGLKYSYA